jgi:hypothetical protein
MVFFWILQRIRRCEYSFVPEQQLSHRVHCAIVNWKLDGFNLVIVFFFFFLLQYNTTRVVARGTG